MMEATAEEVEAPVGRTMLMSLLSEEMAAGAAAAEE